MVTKLLRSRGDHFRINNLSINNGDSGTMDSTLVKKDDIPLDMFDHTILTEERLIKGGESKQFETLRIFASTMNWSHDGKKITFLEPATPGIRFNAGWQSTPE